MHGWFGTAPGTEEVVGTLRGAAGFGGGAADPKSCGGRREGEMRMSRSTFTFTLNILTSANRSSSFAMLFEGVALRVSAIDGMQTLRQSLDDRPDGSTHASLTRSSGRYEL